MVPLEIEDIILKQYLTIYDTYNINNKYYNIYTNSLNKNAKSIQIFYKKNTIKYDNVDLTLMDDVYVKKYWIKYYPLDHIKNNIILAIKKLPVYFRNIEPQILLLENILHNYDTNNKSNIYLLRQYVNILSIAQIEAVGW